MARWNYQYNDSLPVPCQIHSHHSEITQNLLGVIQQPVLFQTVISEFISMVCAVMPTQTPLME